MEQEEVMEQITEESAVVNGSSDSLKKKGKVQTLADLPGVGLQAGGQPL